MDLEVPSWPDWARLTWSGPKVKFTLPSASFFAFPPSSQPEVLTPPLNKPTLAHPFTIPIEWYNAALDPMVPITFALVYATAITYLNSVNARRNNKKWAIARSPLFTPFVLLHNFALSAYSLWTFIGMFNALRISVYDPRGAYGLAGTIDSLCKLNGPRGLGSAATFNGTTNGWGISNRLYHLAKDTNMPDPSDVGRLWNSGLAFYGWLFYISKFYEVIDTLIIIAKGKKSSLLQTYHHAGAMMCMWAGIRYMSPPIWMFVFVNSFIHTIMYAFYFITALGIRIPKPIKQTLTTMQITQFVVGATYAFAHLFIAYQSPVSTSYIYHLGDSVRSIISSVSADASSVIATATSAAAAEPSAWLKKFAFRAAGAEGMAQNVVNEVGQTFGVDAKHAVKDFTRREETRYREELTWVRCVDTSGQAFAIYLNVFYLIPLTWLFAQFFINAYLKRVDARRRSSITERAHIASQSFGDARKGTFRRLSEAYEDYQGVNGDLNDDGVLIDGDEIKKEYNAMTKKAQKAAADATEKVKNVANAAAEKVSQFDTEKAKKDIKAEANRAKKAAKNGAQKVQEVVADNQPSEETKQKVKDTAKQVQDVASDVATKAQDTASGAAAKAQEVYEKNTSDETKEKVNEAIETVSNTAQQASKVLGEKTEEAKKETQKAADQAGKKAEKAKDEVAKQIPDDGEQWEEVGKKAKKKAGQAKDAAAQKIQEGADAAKSKASEASPSPSPRKTPKKADKKLEKEEKKAAQSSDDSADTSISKKDQDKIIDTSQTVRDEEVNTKTEPESTPVEGFSYADAAAEGVPESEKGDKIVVKDEGGFPFPQVEDHLDESIHADDIIPAQNVTTPTIAITDQEISSSLTSAQTLLELNSIPTTSDPSKVTLIPSASSSSKPRPPSPTKSSIPIPTQATVPLSLQTPIVASISPPSNIMPFNAKPDISAPTTILTSSGKASNLPRPSPPSILNAPPLITASPKTASSSSPTTDASPSSIPIPIPVCSPTSSDPSQQPPSRSQQQPQLLSRSLSFTTPASTSASGPTSRIPRPLNLKTKSTTSLTTSAVDIGGIGEAEGAVEGESTDARSAGNAGIADASKALVSSLRGPSSPSKLKSKSMLFDGEPGHDGNRGSQGNKDDTTPHREPSMENDKAAKEAKDADEDAGSEIKEEGESGSDGRLEDTTPLTPNRVRWHGKRRG